MVCWYSCCPLIFKKNKPKRLLFKWDIVAMLLLTFHDIVALGMAIVAFVLADKEKRIQFVPLKYPIFPPLIVALQMSSNLIIIFLMIEFGFRLLEEGPLIGKVTIAVLHVYPSLIYIGMLNIDFIFYMGFHKIRSEEPRKHHGFTSADLFFEVYGFSVFHHIYVVLFETVMSLCVMCCCPKRPPVVGPALDGLPPFEQVTVGGVKVKLQLNTKTRIFTPGDAIGGKIVVEGVPAGSNPTANIVIFGLATVNWRDDGICCCKGRPREGIDTVFSFNVTTSGDFQTNLPSDAPSTFFCGEAPTTGSVSYCITAEVNLNNGPKKDPISIQLPFVVRPLQTTTSPLPINKNLAEFKNSELLGNLIGCIPCKKGPYGVGLKLQKTAFIIGEEITFRAEIYNRSRRPVLNVVASLMSNVVLADESYDVNFTKELLFTKFVPLTWSEVKYGRLKCGASDSWNGKLIVPKTVPESTSLPLSNNIHYTNYYFRFFMEIRGISENVELDIPITIGPPRPVKYASLTLTGAQSQGETLTGSAQSQGSNVDSAASNA